MLGCDVLVNLLAGPTASFGPMLKGELDAVLAPMEKTPFTFDAGVKLGLMGKAGAKVKLWKIELFDWETDLSFGPEWDIWSFSYPSADKKDSKKGNDKLVKQVEEMTKQMTAEAAATKAESQKMWSEFVNMVNNDRDVWNAKKGLHDFDEKDWRGNMHHYTVDELYQAALQAFYTNSFKKYGKIHSSNFTEMKYGFIESINNVAKRIP